MTNLIHGVLMAMRLFLAPASEADMIAEGLCEATWGSAREPDGFGYENCTIGLATWRCEARGECSGGYRVTDTMLVPDPLVAGKVLW